MMKKNLAFLCLSFLSVFLTIGDVQGAIYHVDVSGVITTNRTSSEVIDIGDEWSVSFMIDDAGTAINCIYVNACQRSYQVYGSSQMGGIVFDYQNDDTAVGRLSMAAPYADEPDHRDRVKIRLSSIGSYQLSGDEYLNAISVELFDDRGSLFPDPYSAGFSDLAGLSADDFMSATIHLIIASYPSDGSGHNEITGKVTSYSVQAVPVPAAIWLFGSALVGLIGVNRKQ